MKECKILTFILNDIHPHIVSSAPPAVADFPEIEKFLQKYLNEGFIVKNITDGRGYTFYLERDV